MLYNERQIVAGRWRKHIFLLCIFLALGVSANSTALDRRSKRTQRQELSVADRFRGRAALIEPRILRGTLFSYEYVHGGSAMDGRIYYLQVNHRTFYVLHFTAATDKLKSLREQMDSIARSFRLK